MHSAPHPSRSAPKCVDCRHFILPDWAHRPHCNHPAAPLSLVSGEAASECRHQRLEETAYEQRMGKMDRCGPMGAWFEPHSSGPDALLNRGQGVDQVVSQCIPRGDDGASLHVSP